MRSDKVGALAEHAAWPSRQMSPFTLPDVGDDCAGGEVGGDLLDERQHLAVHGRGDEDELRGLADGLGGACR